ncbi:MAG TPA: 3-phosphoshikimate 1-carboxyvinyltransferase [Candidatus Thermoplasmatota archaeon]|jgi:3-phosphoshikimate 1-carboxyvinyltransferase|nr:3-phosphoshikimate 1-carboxyvinyltransferase [Candidatus Thermoplasmatota archaeon]
MTLTVKPLKGAASGRVTAPPSKSYTHRALMMAFLAGRSKVRRPLWGADTLATRACLRVLGATVEGERDARVQRGPLAAPEDVLNVENSGTTLRLLSGICASLDGASVLTGDASIRGRPMQPLLDALGELGARATSTRRNGRAPVVIEGPMRGGEARLPGDVSSQFLSSLLLACPLAAKDTRVTLTSPLKSKPYVEVTLAMLRHFGLRTPPLADALDIEGGQAYEARDFTVPGDYSSAAFPLVAGAITGGKVTVAGLAPAWPQGDRFILDALRAMGAKVQERGGTATVEAEQLEGATLDLGDTPDLFPILCVAAANARGTTTLMGAPQLKFKESDRILAMTKGLKAMGARVQPTADGAVLHGGAKLHGAAIDTEEDHRILMAFSVAALSASSPVRLNEHASFAVSYPGFLDDLRKLGGRAEVRA